MRLDEFYREIHVDYDVVLGRMMGSEEFVLKFLRKFCEDQTYASLQKAVEAQDYEQVFAAAHTLKGVASNLGLDPLFEKSSELAELTRGGKTCELQKPFEEITESYERMVTLIKTIED